MYACTSFLVADMFVHAMTQSIELITKVCRVIGFNKNSTVSFKKFCHKYLFLKTTFRRLLAPVE